MGGQKEEGSCGERFVLMGRVQRRGMVLYDDHRVDEVGL
jgi:hypothetical protein